MPKRQSHRGDLHGILDHLARSWWVHCVLWLLKERLQVKMANFIRQGASWPRTLVFFILDATNKKVCIPDPKMPQFSPVVTPFDKPTPSPLIYTPTQPGFPYENTCSTKQLASVSTRFSRKPFCWAFVSYSCNWRSASKRAASVSPLSIRSTWLRWAPLL